MPRSLRDLKWEKPKKYNETMKSLPTVFLPFILFEWLMDWFYYLAERSALIRGTIQLIIAVSVITSIVAVLSEISERQEERVIRAWDLLLKAKEQGNFGQKAAVELLHIRGESLRNTDLTGANLHAASLPGADFNKAILRKVDLSNADLSRADLRGAILLDSDMTGANLSKADLREAVFSSKSRGFKDTNLTQANLKEANLEGTILPKFLRGTNFEDANLERANLVLADLRECHLKGANIKNARFDSAVLSGVDLRNINFEGCNVRYANVDRANLGNAKGLDRTKVLGLNNWLLAYFDPVRIKQIGLPADHNDRIKTLNFSKLNLSGVHLFRANLAGANFQQTNLTEADLHSANLRGADFRGANLTRASICGAVDIRLADFRGANLTEIRWQRPSLGDAKVKFANLEGVVNAPDGFVENFIKNGAVAIADEQEWQRVKNSVNH